MKRDPGKAQAMRERGVRKAQENARAKQRVPLGSKPPERKNAPLVPVKEKTCKCTNCGVEFIVGQSKRRTCSPECSNARMGARGRSMKGSNPNRNRQVIFEPDGGRVERHCEAPGCERVYWIFPSQSAKHRCCSRACSSRLKSSRMSGTRTGAANPNYRHGNNMGIHERSDVPRFLDDHFECRNPECRTRDSLLFDQHHTTYRQTVVREGGDPRDGRCALKVCRPCHGSHHLGIRRLPLTALRDENYAVAVALLGPGPAYEWLRRRYAGDDARLDALLTT